MFLTNSMNSETALHEVNTLWEKCGYGNQRYAQQSLTNTKKFVLVITRMMSVLLAKSCSVDQKIRVHGREGDRRLREERCDL
jgi:hypothetical protein